MVTTNENSGSATFVEGSNRHSNYRRGPSRVQPKRRRHNRNLMAGFAKVMRRLSTKKKFLRIAKLFGRTVPQAGAREEYRYIRIISDFTGEISNLSEQFAGQVNPAVWAVLGCVALMMGLRWAFARNGDTVVLNEVLIMCARCRHHIDESGNNEGLSDGISVTADQKPLGSSIDVAEPQSGISDDIVNVIVPFIGMFFTSNTLEIGSLIKELASCTRLIGVFRSLKDLIIVVCRKICELIYPMGANWFKATGHMELDAWNIEVDAFRTKREANLTSVPAEDFQTLKDLEQRGRSILREIPGNPSYSGYKIDLCNQLSYIRKTMSTISSTSYNIRGPRVEPVGLLMMGIPGIGKSVALEYYIRAVAALTLDKEKYAMFKTHPSAFIYNRQAEGVYWDGYDFTKLVTIYDDILQAKDIAGNPDNEGMAIIRNINSFENTLHIAAIEGKGNTLFRSEYVFATTNRQTFRFESIHEPQAFARRWDFPVKAVPKPEYCFPGTQKIDISKLPRNSRGGTLLRPDVCTWHMCDWDNISFTFVPNGTIYEFDQLVNEIVARRRLKETRHSDYLDDLDTMGAQFRSLTNLDKSDDKPLPPEPDEGFLSGRVAGDEWGLDGIDPFIVEPQSGIRDYLFSGGPSFAREQPEWESSIRGDVLLSLSNQESVKKDIDAYHDPSLYENILRARIPWPKKRRVFKCELETHFTAVGAKGALVGIVCNYLASKDELYELYKTFREDRDKLSFFYACLQNRLSELDVLHTQPNLDHYDSDDDDEDRGPIRGFFHDLKLRLWAFVRFIWLAVAGCAAKVMEILKKAFTAEGFLFETSMGLGSYVNIPVRINIPPLLMAFAVAAGTLTIIYTTWTIITIIYSLGKVVYSWFAPPVSEQSTDLGNRKGNQSKTKPRKLPRTFIKPEAVPQGNIGDDPVDPAKFIASRHSRKIIIHDITGKPVVVGYIIGISARLAILNYHTASQILGLIDDPLFNENTEIAFSDDIKNNIHFKMTLSEFCKSVVATPELEKTDIAVLRCPQGAMFRDIMKQLNTDAQIDKIKTVQAELLLPGPDSFSLCVNATRDVAVSLNPPGQESYVIPDVFKYAGASRKGYCGALLITRNSSMQRKVLGFHIAGNRVYGYSKVLTIELVQSIKDYAENELGFTLAPPTPPDASDLPNPVTTLMGVTVPQSMVTCSEFVMPGSRTPNVQRQTKLRKTPLHGLLRPVKTAPAKLRPDIDENGRRINDPLINGIVSYIQPKPWVNSVDLSLAVNHEMEWIVSQSPNKVRPSIFTFTEAVTGLELDSDFGSISRQTSCGWPYNTSSNKKNKEDFFGNKQDYDLTTVNCELLKSECNRIINEAKNGRRCFHLFTDFLKDERRSKKKVVTGSTRIVSAAPLALVILSRMYFGSFGLFILKNRIQNGYCIGMNPYDSDWNMLTRELDRYGRSKNCSSGDFKGFDKNQTIQIQSALLDIVEFYYWNSTPEERMIRQVLWLEMINSYHITDGVVMSWIGSMPSGHPLTSIVDCLYNRVLFRLCHADYKFRQLGCDRYDSFLYFDQEVRLFVLGDDNIRSVAEPSLAFTDTLVSELMWKYGSQYTLDTKDEENFGDGYRSLEDCSFLKRSFVYSSSFDKAPIGLLSLDTIYDMVCWYHKGANSDTAIRDTIQEALIECSAYPDDIFDEFKTKLLNAIHDSGLDVNVELNLRLLRRRFRKNDGLV